MAQDENSTTLTKEEFTRLLFEYKCGAPIRKGWQIWRNGEPYFLTMREIAIIQGKEEFPPEQDENSKPAYEEFDPYCIIKCSWHQGVTHYGCLLESGHEGKHEWDIPDQEGRLRNHPQYMTGHVLDSDKPTLRDQFAMAAVAGIIQKSWPSSQEALDDDAGLVYRIADAMMAARKNPPK